MDIYFAVMLVLMDGISVEYNGLYPEAIWHQAV